MAKKATREASAKSVIALLITLLVFTIFILFYTNKDIVSGNGNFQSLVILITVGMGLLVTLLYLVNASGSSKKRR